MYPKPTPEKNIFHHGLKDQGLSQVFAVEIPFSSKAAAWAPEKPWELMKGSHDHGRPLVVVAIPNKNKKRSPLVAGKPRRNDESNAKWEKCHGRLARNIDQPPREVLLLA